GRPVDLEADDLARVPAAVLVEEGGAADERPFVELYKPAKAHLERRILLRFDDRFLAAVEVDLDQQQASFYTRHVERQHADCVNIERATARHERVPDVGRPIPRHPDLESQVARVATA